MYEYDFTNIHLPQKEYSLLKRSRKNKHKYSAAYDNLIQIGMMEYVEYSFDNIGQQIPIKTYCQISEKGLCYIQYCKNRFVDNRIPILISVLALIISLITA